MGSSLLKPDVIFAGDLGALVQGVAQMPAQSNRSVNVSEMFVEWSCDFLKILKQYKNILMEKKKAEIYELEALLCIRRYAGQRLELYKMG